MSAWQVAHCRGEASARATPAAPPAKSAARAGDNDITITDTDITITNSDTRITSIAPKGVSLIRRRSESVETEARRAPEERAAQAYFPYVEQRSDGEPAGGTVRAAADHRRANARRSESIDARSRWRIRDT